MRTDYPDSSVTYAYGDDPDANNMGQLIETKNDDVTERTTYGPLGEVLTVARDVKTRQPGVDDYDWVIRYAYNYLGQMTDITYPNAETVSYHYDAGGQVDGITGTCLGHDVTYVRDIGYDHFGQRVSLAYGNGTTTTYDYDPARRWLKSLSTVLDSTMENLQTLSYSFDLNGNVTYFKDTSETKTYEQTYGYDDLDQLISARGDYIDTKSVVVRTANYTQAYNYDRIGNMLGKTSTLVRNPAKAEDQKLNYSLSYAYEGKGPHQATMVGDTHYVYDDNGNVTSMVPDWEWKNYSGPKYADFTVRTVSEKLDVADAALGADRSPADQQNMSGTRYMEWDWENRLTGVKEGRMSVAYAYDAGGERRLKVEGATETVYWDRMYEVENSSSYPVASIHVYLGTSRLVSKLSILDNPDFLTESGNTFYYHADHLGSSSLITDNKGREYERMAFTPHGEVWQHDTLDTLERIDLLFTGKAMDAETGWYYFGARYLDPRTGMWLSGDPALGEYVPQAPLTQEAKDANGNLPGMGGVYNPVNLALYHYAGNNPIKYLDPDGREIRNNQELKFVSEVLGDIGVHVYKNSTIFSFFENNGMSTPLLYSRQVWLGSEIFNEPMNTRAGRNTFIHELFHQVQYLFEPGGASNPFSPSAFETLLTEAMLYRRGNGIDVYDYGDLTKYSTLSDMEFYESQAQMVGDFAELYYEGRYGNGLTDSQKKSATEMARILEASGIKTEATKWVQENNQ